MCGCWFWVICLNQRLNGQGQGQRKTITRSASWRFLALKKTAPNFIWQTSIRKTVKSYDFLSLTFFPQQENANCRKAFLKQVSKRHSNLTKWLCTSWKLGASYIVINRKLFKFFAVSKMKLLVEFSIVQPSIRMARLATFLKVGLVWRKFTFAIFTIISLVFLAK